MAARTRYVAVVGPGRCGAELAQLAEEVGRALARRGATLVCGGLSGAMEAACRGAREEGGLTIGLLPGNDRASANEFVSIALPTGLGEARNALVARAGDAMIAVGGEFGTLSEIALALKLGKRVVGLDTWELSKGGNPVAGIEPARDPEHAVALALADAGEDP